MAEDDRMFQIAANEGRTEMRYFDIEAMERHYDETMKVVTSVELAGFSVVVLVIIMVPIVLLRRCSKAASSHSATQKVPVGVQQWDYYDRDRREWVRYCDYRAIPEKYLIEELLGENSEVVGMEEIRRRRGEVEV